MNLKYFIENNNFYQSLRKFFNELDLPFLDYEQKYPLLGTQFFEKSKNKELDLVDEVYPLGAVNEEAFSKNLLINFAQNTSEFRDLKYDGIQLLGIKLKRTVTIATKSQLCAITRACNREFLENPVVVVFQYDKYISVANCERTSYSKSQTWREGERAGKVSLLKDIFVENVHAGHERILNDLIINGKGKDGISSFEELYKYWQSVFDTNILNNRFYKEISNWYFWAVENVKFPIDDYKTRANYLSKTLEEWQNEANKMAVIRLLTRIIFVWFIKEKKLIPHELFDYKILNDSILNFKEITNSIYYKAILQNLFFATLNTPIPAENEDDNNSQIRTFIETDSKKQKTQKFEVSNFYRYKRYFKNPEFALQLFKTVPFLNGGLFECLDDRENKIFVDAFTNPIENENILLIPDKLFFNENNSTEKGLINILESYKFTVEENTPLEEDIALDPELLGKVFENLLASYNPETQTTARKATGSFYTPREIVDYMVEQSLIAYIVQFTKNNAFLETEQLSDFEKDITKLVKTETPENPFANNELLTKTIVNALGNAKILDPACGSGAFPMGALNKIVGILKTIDSDNKYWRIFNETKIESEYYDKLNEIEINKKIIEKITFEDLKQKNLLDLEVRRQQILEAFNEAKNERDYARKLYIIENCLFGVDIQPIAIQISKLRFFLSLVIEQKENRKLPNYGILPLPNLETKLVAANTLIGIEKTKADLFSGNIIAKEKELEQLRKKYFTVSSRKEKLKLKDEDKQLRAEISTLLEKNKNVSHSVAVELAKWNPYDQNKSSNWFDTEWMFGLTTNGNMQSVEITLLNKQIDSINEQIKTINISLAIDKIDEIKKLQFETANLQIDTIKKEIENIKINIENIYGKISTKIRNIVSEPEDYSYQINSLNSKIKKTNSQIEKISKQLKPVSENCSGYFDIVFGNPPYIQIQKFSGKNEQKMWEEQKYKTYSKSGDIYCLFYENGINILKTNGIHCFVTSNKWMRAGYGELLRKFFASETQPLKLLDFGGQKVFENATVDVNIILLKKDENTQPTLACSIKEDFLKHSDISTYFQQNAVAVNFNHSDTWAIGTNAEQIVKQKIESVGKPLKEWDFKFIMGLKTGLKEAFVIDTFEKEKLISINIKNGIIIKPFLRGRDIDKFSCNLSNLWLINSHNGLKSKNLKPINVKNEYPAIYKHLEQFLPAIEKRQDKGDHWSNLRNCAYLDEFEKDRIIYPDIARHNSFSLCKGGIYSDNTTYNITTDSKYILGVLNSKLIEFYYRSIANSLGEKGIRFFTQYVEQIPIPQISKELQHPFISLVDSIIAKKKAGENTQQLETKIDIMVYKLYELTFNEAKIIDPEIEKLISQSEYDTFAIG